MTGDVSFIAQPWWVNLLALVPVAAFWWYRRAGVQVTSMQLALLSIWALAFGFVESAVVVYLRAIIGMALGNEPSFASIAQLSAGVLQSAPLELPSDLVALEMWREAATIVMLLALAGLVGRPGWKERSACFLWSFAVWDLAYYLGLRLTLGWPSTLTTPDVLFLIPEPWVAQVWFPLLVSLLTLVAIGLSGARRPARHTG